MVICASLPMAYSLFKRLPESKLGSYFSSLVVRLTGPGSKPSSDGSGGQLPVLGNNVKHRYWNKLEDSLFDSQASEEGQSSQERFGRDASEEFELVAAHEEGVSTNREYWELAAARNIV